MLVCGNLSAILDGTGVTCVLCSLGNLLFQTQCRQFVWLKLWLFSKFCFFSNFGFSQIFSKFFSLLSFSLCWMMRLCASLFFPHLPVSCCSPGLSLTALQMPCCVLMMLHLHLCPLLLFSSSGGTLHLPPETKSLVNIDRYAAGSIFL